MTSRRDILKLSVGAAAIGAGPLSLAAAAAQHGSTAPRRQRPKNIIFMVADGMSAGVPSLAEPFSRLVRDRSTHFAAMAAAPGVVHGWVDSASLDSLVTDSASASSAWATGSRIANGMINMLPDGTELVPIGQLAKDQGRSLGLVTTTRVTHATPAGFVATVPQRRLEDEIARQYLNAVDVLLGGGQRHFDEPLIARFRDAGYEVLSSRSDLTTARGFGSMMLGLFTPSHFPYVLDRRHDAQLESAVPTLAEMTHAALVSLSGSSNGFLLQVEGGRVDHAAHGNDAAGLMWEQLDFDDALGVVLEFIADRDDTLLVVTTDHGNANPGLNGIGGGYRGSTPSFERLGHFTASCSRIHGLLLRAENEQEIADVIHTGTDIEIQPEDAARLATVLRDRPVPELNQQLSGVRGQLGQILGNHTGVMFTGITHTADWAMLMALGPGSESFSGFQRNTDVFEALTAAMEIDHRNPTGDVNTRRRLR